MKKELTKRRSRAIIITFVAVFLVLILASYGPNVKSLLLGTAKFALPWTEKFPFLKKVTEAPTVPKARPGEEGVAETQRVVPVIVHKVARQDFEDILPVMGTIKGQKEVNLRFEINGVIDSVNFKEGDMVSQGDVVVTLDQKDVLLKLEYSQSKSEAARTQALAAEKRFQMHEDLYEIGAIIKNKLEEMELEYENAKNQAASAEKEVEFAQAELEKTYLLSPIDGVMGSKEVESGEFVTSQNKVTTIIDIENVFVETGVIEKEIQKVALGQMASITVDAYPNMEFSGTIDNILPVIEGKSRTLTCKIKVKNPNAQLLPGMFARASIFIFRQDNAVVVPNAALVDQDDDGVFDSTYVITTDNVAELRKLSVGYLTTDYAVINWGLKESELVVIEARGELSDGARVEVLETQEAFGAGAETKEEEQKDIIIR